MPIYRAQVTLNRRSGIPRDAVTNSWTFLTDSPNAEAVAGSVTTQLELFYAAIRSFLSNTLSQEVNANRVKLYRLTPGQAGPQDDVLGPPLAQRSWSMGPTATGSAAAELAVALSFNADIFGISEEQGTSRPANRRRGRVFIGPLGDNTGVPEPTTNELRPSDGFRNSILDAVMTMNANLAAIAPAIIHVAYSAMDNVTRPIVRYSVDNAYDVQRRRGVRPTNKLQRLVIA